MNHKKHVTPVPCEHIAAYYQMLWENQRCIAYNLLRIGYKQWSSGQIWPEGNNLYHLEETIH